MKCLFQKKPKLFLKVFNFIQQNSYKQGLEKIKHDMKSIKDYNFDNLINDYQTLLTQEFKDFNYLILNFEELQDLIFLLYDITFDKNYSFG